MQFARRRASDDQQADGLDRFDRQATHLFAVNARILKVSFAQLLALLVANDAGAVALAVRMPHAFNAAVMVPFHALFAALVVAATVRLDKSRYSREGIAGYYRFIWYLFYSEYALLPFI